MATFKDEFEQLSQQSSDPGLVREFWAFLRDNKKWWLLPFIAAILLLGLLVVLSGSAAAPFIYTLF